MRIYDVIEKKAAHHELTKEELQFFVEGLCSGKVPDYQAAALIMAMFLNGMSDQETADLTAVMADSGEHIDLSGIDGVKVDKHSTGGIGDKTTLIIGPIIAACGGKMAKMSGRGLGCTGGTIDKLESIPGFQTSLTQEQFIHNVNAIGMAVTGQTANVAPADKKIYALRDVTATVASIPLIASSIMSKKLASGADKLVLDVKMGSGAFVKDLDGAKKLAEISFDEMLELATLGAQVLHNRSVEMAKRYGVNLEVLSSFSGKPGTKVKEVAKTMEKLHVSGVACDKNVARVAVVGLADEPGIAFKIFSLLAKERINVDLILQSIGRNNTKDISFTVSIQDVERCKQLLDEHRDFLQFDHVDVNDKIAKVSIVGAGMVHNPGVAAKMFEALYNAGINISMISTSEIKVSVLVDINEADRAVQVIHDRFFSEFGTGN